MVVGGLFVDDEGLEDQLGNLVEGLTVRDLEESCSLARFVA